LSTTKQARRGSPLRRAARRLDRAVSPPADALVRTNLFADSVAAVTRLEARMRRTVEGRTAAYWHFFNLPTASDMRRVRGQLSMLEARLRDLDERVELGASPPPPGAAPRAAAPEQAIEPEEKD